MGTPAAITALIVLAAHVASAAIVVIAVTGPAQDVRGSGLR
jgi:hypothetical protein